MMFDRHWHFAVGAVILLSSLYQVLVRCKGVSDAKPAQTYFNSSTLMVGRRPGNYVTLYSSQFIVGGVEPLGSPLLLD